MDELNLDLITIRNFAIAILIGALIGIEREKRRTTEPMIGGLRTFILLAMLGALGGLLSASYNSMVPLLVVLGFASLTVVAGFLMAEMARRESLSLTTELAGIGVTLLGGFATLGQPELAVGLGIFAAAVLAYKQPLHGLIDKFGWDDIFAGLRLLIATFIVLPLLPNRALDPWQALNPRQLWLFVVLISALSMVGYVATRWLGPGRGAAITGITGGLVSSTATTLAFSRQSRALASRSAAQSLVSGTLLSWTIMFARVVVIAFAVSPSLLPKLAPSMLAMGLATAGLAAALHWRERARNGAAVQPTAELVIATPFSLTQAVKFGLIYAAILLLVRIVGDSWSGGEGLLLVAALAGTTDVDAITLSMSQYAHDGGAAAIAVAGMVIATISNTIVKGGMALMVGSPDYRRGLVVAMILVSVVGAVAAIATASLT